MNFGTEGLHMCVTEHYHLQANLVKVFQKFKQNIKGSAKDAKGKNTKKTFPSSERKAKGMSHAPILQKNNIILFDFIQRQYVKFYAKL